jgi:glycosyltransferase involved in cell wall biosynthesis
MNKLKFLIILLYYKRPTIVLNALESIKNLSYNNWQLDFIDDSGNEEFKETLLNYGLDNSKVNYISINDSESDKISQGGSRHGAFINKSIHNSNSDIIITLCDDDALVNGYFEYLNEYYQLNPEVNWAYSKVLFFDPTKEHYSQSTFSTQYTHPGSVYNVLNNWEISIDPSGKVDGSQVSFKTKVFKEGNLFYPSPKTRNLDADIFDKIYKQYGLCYPTFTYSQYKGVFDDQLGNRWKSEQSEYKIKNI